MKIILVHNRTRAWDLFCQLSFILAASMAWHDNCPAAEARKPSLIVIFTDDHGYSDLSCQGVRDDVKTPHLDALAEGGVRMTSGYVTAPQCVPSRTGLLSGIYQNRLGVESNGSPLDGFNAQRTIAERLKEVGYATGQIGKWHLGPANQIVDHGFDDVFYQNGSWTNFDVAGNDVQLGTPMTDLYHLDANNAAAQAFIKRHHDRPFFLYLAYRAPHVPLDATEKYLRRFPGEMPERRRQALAMLSAVDDGVGGVMQSLREFGIEQNTLIFFIGDNGAPLKIHKIDAPGGGPGWDGSLNEPLNGEKGMLSEGGIRVPFVVYWKGQIPGGQVYDHPVISLDVAATALALADLPADSKLDGVNLLPYLRGETDKAPHETLYWRWIAQSAVREGCWKYLRGGAREYLFDVEADRGEKQNLIQEHPEIAARLRTKLDSWAQQLNPPGLETKQMAATWEQYFDHYLDGKPAPLPSPGSPRGQNARTSAIKGWIARNSIAELTTDGLRIRTDRQRRRAFMVAAGLDLPAPVTAVVRLRTQVAGTAGFAWRESGQEDFPANQVVAFDCAESNEFHEYKITLPAAGTIIHVRLLLPQMGADIEQVEFRQSNGVPLQSWTFRAGSPISESAGSESP